MKGKRLKGDGSSSAAAGSVGTGAEWDGTETGRKKKTKESVADWRVHHTTMEGREQGQSTTASRKVWVGNAETKWGEPISQKARKALSLHFEAKLKKYGGKLTQAVAVKLTLKDRWLQRYVISERLDMRASDVVWAWVAQQVLDGKVVPGERVYRPEIGKLAGTEEPGLWKLVAQATTGWDVTVRQKISRATLSRVVLSRQVLKSIYRVYDRDMAKQWGVTIKEVQDMVLDPVMTPNLATMVWQNSNKQAGLVEGGGAGRRVSCRGRGGHTIATRGGKGWQTR